MKTALVLLFHGIALGSLAQVETPVRVEKRIMVIKDGSVLQSPPDSLLKGLHIEIDSSFSGGNLKIRALGREGEDQLMFFQPQAMTGPMLGIRIAQTEGVRGVTVQSVEPISTAAALGLQVGDVIASINGTAVLEPKQLVELIRRLNVGSAVDVRFRRDGAKKRMKGYLIPLGGPSLMPQMIEGMPIRIEMQEEREEREF
ncbi:MAG: PDZ domain-containing protein [Bacteroidetes bacterium]|nr:PDZ domain-containing protein [Bacteroidota bacterium]